MDLDSFAWRHGSDYWRNFSVKFFSQISCTPLICAWCRVGKFLIAINLLRWAHNPRSRNLVNFVIFLILVDLYFQVRQCCFYTNQQCHSPLHRTTRALSNTLHHEIITQVTYLTIAYRTQHRVQRLDLSTFVISKANFLWIISNCCCNLVSFRTFEIL